jgi:hypothetical protein
MPDLVEFLEARLAEREAESHQIHNTHSDHWLDSGCICDEPAFVLADIASKRRILAHHNWVAAPLCITWSIPSPLPDPYCETCGSDECPTLWPCDTIKLLAAPFDQHPDYDPSWRIDA